MPPTHTGISKANRDMKQGGLGKRVASSGELTGRDRLAGRVSGDENAIFSRTRGTGNLHPGEDGLLDHNMQPKARPGDASGDATALLLDKFAKGLQETAERASELSHQHFQPDLQSVDSHGVQDWPAPHHAVSEGARQHDSQQASDFSLPQILRARPSPQEPAGRRWDLGLAGWWLHGHPLSPAGLSVAFGVGTLVFVALVNVMAGLHGDVGLQASTPKDTHEAQALTAPTLVKTIISSPTSDVHASASSFGPIAAFLSEPKGGSGDDEVATSLETTDAMVAAGMKLIETGEIHQARETLARAASRGSATARFALAETYDPIMLAAWGRREPLADVNLARTLYGQALQAGEQRAQLRLKALSGSGK